ncbi:Diphthine methyltransferase [Cytospora mali]|uniref:Diphthine methyltransferase n=1 Tax=Cytospora mali TaxID=578113 RepID=A0A194W851_CYTMA|nr:Diphthine methyltransferase [Valsa mali]
MDGLAECNLSIDMTISSSQSMQLDLPPSCIEFCPAHPSYFLVGTYNLQKEENGERGAGESEAKEEEQDKEREEGLRAQSRTGSIIVFQLQNGKARRIQTIPQPSAVFDLHFAPQPDRGDICAAVSSTGTISLFRLSPGQPLSTTAESEAAVLEPLSSSSLKIQDSDENTLLTYFAWHPTVLGLMAVTTATGKVMFVQVDEGYQGIAALGTPVIEHGTEIRRGYQGVGDSERPIIEEPIEAWCVAFSNLWDVSPESQNFSLLSTVFSGGDDSALRLRSYWLAENVEPDSNNNSNEESSDEGSNGSPVRFNLYGAKTVTGHYAGVTVILPLPITMSDGSQLVLTGSYDDTLRAWAITPPHKNYGRPKTRVLGEENLGGGVWRLKVIEELSSMTGPGPWTIVVLTSCMHAGTRVLRIRGGADLEGGVEIEVLSRFEEHKSMNYGSDYSRVEGTLLRKEGKREAVCVSTSFYDRLLCVWEFEAPV